MSTKIASVNRASGKSKKRSAMKAPPPKGFQVLTAPIKIPDVLPDIDRGNNRRNR